ncbi:nitrate- and nitrite sensing domain-containing protein [Actinomadura rugatobispora]|uniref:histidine kinase n=1 Tax=Actinomadura rugatobispora TaxID=1994 RepID=A0ABW1A275_9ACTN|nr:nitrate- and nitrite sensing domain-containing protein [Actinomadura rugatobispora]
MPKNEEEGGSAERVRLRPVGRRIGLLLVVPLLSLVGLWAFAAAVSLGAALDRIEFTRTVDDVARPIGLVGNALQVERTAAATVLGTRGAQGADQLRVGQRGTDGALAAFRAKSLPAAGDVADGRTLRFLRDLDREYGRLGPLRAQIASGGIAPLAAIGQYNALFDSTNRALSNLATADDVEVHQTTQTLVDVNWAQDFMMREDALLQGAQIRGGRIPAAAHTAFVEAAANRRHLTGVSFAGPSAAVRQAFDRLSRSPQFARYQRLEQAIAASRDRRVSEATLAEWRATQPAVIKEWWQGTLAATAELTEQTESAGRGVVYRLVLVGGLGLLVVLASVVLSLKFARGLSRELRGLQKAAQELARERLPRVVARLRRGEEVAVADEAPPIRTGRTKEIALVADAFTTVQRTAIETAVGEAQVRAGISRVFINLAWRSQSLLQRQLRMLDAMERRATDPDELENLFRLDHLTTRMRRHAEGLVILSGQENVRGWKEPVPVEHLLRAALAEVEDYARVDVMALTQARVQGAVAADVVHLLAELIENATAYSPPTTEVLVRAELVGNGLAVEVVDRGVGMDPDDLAETNRRLADPPEFDLADSDRLGLFVVARLAVRHGIKVVLQRSAYGGVTAVALLPTDLLAPGEAPAVHGAATGREPRQIEHKGAAIGGGAVAALAPSGPAEGRFEVDGRHHAPRPSSPPVAVATPESEDAGHDERPSKNGRRGGGFDAETGGLPRRSRQRHLAPQLRAPGPRHRRSASRPGWEPALDETPGERPAEHNRDLLSSLQAGWSAGREDDEDATTVFEERLDRGDL